jgi:hypothetical protein
LLGTGHTGHDLKQALVPPYMSNQSRQDEAGGMRQVLLIAAVAALLGGCGTMVTDGYPPTFDVKELYEKLERQSGGGGEGG